MVPTFIVDYQIYLDDGYVNRCLPYTAGQRVSQHLLCIVC